MTRQKGKKSSRDLEHSLDKLEQIHRQRRQAYQEFIESIQSLQPLERAEAWLMYAADDYECYGDQEAIVYLVSRGYDCAERIRDVVSTWKHAAQRSIEGCMREVRPLVVDSKTGTTEWGEVILPGKHYAEASDILDQSPFWLRDFWGGSDYQEFSIDATMLRTVEWCNIGGFDEWWLRLANEHYEAVTQGGIEPIPASFFLFNMCRSDYAIQLMRKAFNRMLEAIELSEPRQPYPWRRWTWGEDTPRAIDHFTYAASIVFANERLCPHHSDTELVDRALEALLKHQDTVGYWRCWADNPEPAMDTTAMVIHALAMKRPRGWELAASAARDWLWSVQDRSGCWVDSGCPDSVYLTVLVLDALELAGGGSRVTFGLAPSLVQKEVLPMHKIKALFLAANPADTQKLSLDKQIRAITEKIRATDYRDLLELVSVWAVRPDDLLQSLNEHRPHIVHFSGHGSQAGEILVVGDNDQSRPISTKAIKTLFKTLKDNIRVVILDACYSKSQAEAITEVVDCAIGMDDAVGEAAATIFTASFYRAIGFGRSVQEAFDQGIAALLLENIPEENVPKLLVKSGVDASQVFLIGGASQ
ncbi:MAG: CHAT domain-containing protein [Chloroflexi bacterium]|nr:CHAT domain-containing protein [Chloroflexota bacterium]MBU1746962.1 CHAT domain-containing protein [Chloroflexota bacterium]